MSILGDKRLTGRQIIAAALLAEGLSQHAIAEAVKVSQPVVWRWTQLPHFLAEKERALDRLRDRVQALSGTRTIKAMEMVDSALEATEDNTPTGLPLWSIRLRAFEASADVFEKLSRRPEQLQATAAGPLIVLPGGAQPMALLIGSSTQPSAEPATQTPSIDVQAVPVPPVLPAGVVALEPQVVEVQGSELEPVTPGLPQWWRKSKPVNK